MRNEFFYRMPLPERSNIPFGPNSENVQSNGQINSLQDLFARFDKGVLSESKFKDGLVSLGYELTPQLQRLMAASGGSCTVSFTSLVKALKRSDNEEVSSNFGITPRSFETSDRHSEVQRAVDAFINGMVSVDELRRVLAEFGIMQSPELERVLRRHEQDHSKTFHGLAMILEKYGISLSRKSHESGSMRGLLGQPHPPSNVRSEIKRQGGNGNFISWQ